MRPKGPSEEMQRIDAVYKELEAYHKEARPFQRTIHAAQAITMGGASKTRSPERGSPNDRERMTRQTGL
jgi:hypothetical protein